MMVSRGVLHDTSAQEGFAAVYPDALARSRELKAGIPMTGLNGIPLRDEIELEIALE